MAPHGIPKNLSPLKDLSPDNVFLDMDDDEDLLFRTNLSLSTESARSHLTKRYLIALELTDIYCELDKGKVSLRL